MRKTEEWGEGGGLLERLWNYGNLVVDTTEVIKILPAPNCMVLILSFFFLNMWKALQFPGPPLCI